MRASTQTHTFTLTHAHTHTHTHTHTTHTHTHIFCICLLLTFIDKEPGLGCVQQKPVPSSLADKLNQCLQRRLSRPWSESTLLQHLLSPAKRSITTNDNNDDDDDDDDEDVYVEIPDSDDEDDNYDRVDEDDEDDNYDLPLDPPEELQNTAIGKKTERAAGLVSGSADRTGGREIPTKVRMQTTRLLLQMTRVKQAKSTRQRTAKRKRFTRGKLKTKTKRGNKIRGEKRRCMQTSQKTKSKSSSLEKRRGTGKAENVYTKGNNPGQTGKTTAAVVKPVVRVAPQEAGRVTLPSSQTTRLADRPPMPSPYNVSPVEGTGIWHVLGLVFFFFFCCCCCHHPGDLLVITIMIIIAFKGAIRDFHNLLTAPRFLSTRTLKWPGRSSVQITCNTSSVFHVQHVVCHRGAKGHSSY